MNNAVLVIHIRHSVYQLGKKIKKNKNKNKDEERDTEPSLCDTDAPPLPSDDNRPSSVLTVRFHKTIDPCEINALILLLDKLSPSDLTLWS